MTTLQILIGSAGVMLAANMVAPAALHAQTTSDSTAVARRAAQVAAMINGATLQADSVFAPVFLAQVPAARLTALFGQLAAQTGRVEQIDVLGPGTPGDSNSARLRFTMSKNAVIPVTIHVGAAAPHLVDGLLFGAPTSRAATMADVVSQLAALHGQVSFLASRVEGDRLVPVAQLDSARALAIGSAFKLYVLAELVRSVEVGTRHWTDVVRLDSTRRSLASGVTQTWPAGTPVTVQTLATLMISQSDNTAADALLHAVGRENVERAQRMAGSVDGARNEPFLTTREMFLLKSPVGAELAARFRAGDEAVRRQVVAQLDTMPQRDVAPDFAAGPVAIDAIEWFASAADLSRTMLWLRDRTDARPTAPARSILAVNRGLSLSSGTWPYVGFKGGSEPGVLNLTLLLRHRSGDWYVVSASWNDSAKAVDEAAFVGLIQRAVELLAPT